ncbi:MAG: hypothetical protein HYS87_02105 [Candidatus Colwellbacteria bacterium]|nr:hypothetical protein [Candidatus Colwellbacteria bacterium]
MKRIFIVLGVLSVVFISVYILQKNNDKVINELNLDSDDGYQTIKIDSLNVRRDLDIFSKKADTIVIGTIKSIGEAYATRVSKTNLIYTPVFLDVETYIKNPKISTELRFDVLGGTVDNVRLIADGPEFKVGERVLVFLGKLVNGNLVVYAGSSGEYLLKDGMAFSVIDNEVLTEAELVSRILSNLNP